MILEPPADQTRRETQYSLSKRDCGYSMCIHQVVNRNGPSKSNGRSTCQGEGYAQPIENKFCARGPRGNDSKLVA